MKRLTLLTIILIVSAAIGYFRLQFTPAVPETSTDDVTGMAGMTDSTALEQKLIVLLHHGNPSQVYKNYMASLKNKNPGEQHMAMHVIGGALYDGLGIKGASYCDNSFWSACFDGFGIAAIRKNGIAYAKPLAKICGSLSYRIQYACLHGVGHAYVLYFGTDHIHDALDACQAITLDTRISCVEGAFMEYTSRILAGLRSDPDDPRVQKTEFISCPSLSDFFQPTCYFYQIKIWFEQYKEKFDTLAKRCDAIASDVSRRECYNGIGAIIGSDTKKSLKEKLALCETVTPESGKKMCRSGVKDALCDPNDGHKPNDLAVFCSEK